MIISEREPALLMKMKALRPSLSRAEQQVVDYIIGHPETVIYLSVAGLAENSGVSDATVVRTCRSLGLNGYQDLKVTLAQDIVTPLQSIHEEINEGDSVSVIVDKVFQGTLHALNFTHDTLKVEAIEQAAEAIMKARTVIVMGLGNSHSVAIDLQHKLMRLGMLSIAFTDSHMQAIAASQLTPDDVVFAISHSGSSMDIVDSVRLAKDNGVKTISLTNIGISPLSKITDIQLYTASKETRFRIVALNSRIAQMAIIDVLYTVLASRLPEAVTGFHRLEKALNKKKY
ncbi:MAG: putative HTH-type transcriptional regulator YbbH [Firmicutes bacterium ADurb.Bin182]|nr:MAG: putative HTH-type transcriptional regulator YbbH [Firmicutes bacterium ADurb.Bin182]